MRDVTKTLEILMAATLVTGCLEMRPITWEYTDSQPVADGEVYVATIREDGCSPVNDLLYFSFPQLGTTPVPTLDDEGEYCFEMLVFEEDTCLATRGSQEPVRTDGSMESISVLNAIVPLPSPRDCESYGGTCAPDVGCVQCPRGQHLCTPDLEDPEDRPPEGLEYRYCCGAEGLCNDPVFFGCEQLR